VRNDARAWIKGDRIGACAFLGDKTTYIQSESSGKEQRTKDPSKAAMH
jgi:hypothetical protein